MRDSPRVSVVMAVHNGERYLREAVNSILTQTFTNFEFIIIDDGSTDKTRDILESYSDPRLVYLFNHQNEGLPASLNRGLRVAKGEYIARQDADDISMPERLAHQVAHLDSYSQVGLLGCWAMIIDENGNSIGLSRKPLTNEEIQKRLHRSACMVHGSVMYRRVCVEQAGDYRPFFRRAQDRDLWLRLARICEINNLSKPLYQWRFTPEGHTVRRVVQHSRYSLLAVEANEKLECFINEEALQIWGEKRLHPNIFSSYAWHGRQYRAGICWHWAKFTFSQGLFRQGLRLYIAALFFAPFDYLIWRSLVLQILGKRNVQILGALRRRFFGPKSLQDG